ncbi:MAG: hypothetical protein JWM37_607 [Candidatus Saccharibacteria bacterium]|nr:hypothetical protein [Candidatus Saccharibacteria bacterium]
MSWVLLAVGLILGCFSFVVFFGAPYLPTLTPQVTAALDMAALKPGQHLLELGSGDGKVLLAAAQRGIHVTGYEINPLLAAYSWVRTRRYRHLVTVRCADFWRTDWPKADAVFVFLLPKYMAKLDAKLNSLKNPVRLVSFAFEIPDREPAERREGVFTYDYPGTRSK